STGSPAMVCIVGIPSFGQVATSSEKQFLQSWHSFISRSGYYETREKSTSYFLRHTSGENLLREQEYSSFFAHFKQGYYEPPAWPISRVRRYLRAFREQQQP